MYSTGHQSSTLNRIILHMTNLAGRLTCLNTSIFLLISSVHLTCILKNGRSKTVELDRFPVFLRTQEVLEKVKGQRTAQVCVSQGATRQWVAPFILERPHDIFFQLHHARTSVQLLLPMNFLLCYLVHYTANVCHASGSSRVFCVTLARSCLPCLNYPFQEQGPPVVLENLVSNIRFRIFKTMAYEGIHAQSLSYFSCSLVYSNTTNCLGII